jgi:dTDP-4-amino-4,6-dideoxygalactose transaminase
MKTIPLFDCRLGDAEIEALRPVLASGMLTSGPKVAAFERELSTFLGREHVVAVSNITEALTIGLQLAGVRPGDEVLTLAYVCLSSNTAIAQAGAVPVWVDIDPEHATISVEDCEAAIGPRTKALVAYHVSGYPAPLDALRALCDSRGLALIEDANNAIGARWKGGLVGATGRFAAHSFYANRQVNAIEGAALTCPDRETAAEAIRLRRFGVDGTTFRDSLGEIDPASDVPRIGRPALMSDVNAALGLCRLRSLEERLSRTRRNAAQLVEGLRGVAGIVPVLPHQGAEPAFWTCLFRAERRDALMAALKRNGVQCSKLHQPNDAYTGFGARPRDLPGTRRLMREVLALPCGWWLDDEDVGAIVSAVRNA